MDIDLNTEKPQIIKNNTEYVLPVKKIILLDVKLMITILKLLPNVKLEPPVTTKVMMMKLTFTENNPSPE